MATVLGPAVPILGEMWLQHLISALVTFFVCRPSIQKGSNDLAGLALLHLTDPHSLDRILSIRPFGAALVGGNGHHKR